MDAQLLALAKAQDDFRQQVAVGLTDLKSIYDACAREHGNEVKQRANEHESARRAIEGANAERDKLEQKLVQCEHALSETKHALVETREKAKDVRVVRCDACAREREREMRVLCDAGISKVCIIRVVSSGRGSRVISSAESSRGAFADVGYACVCVFCVDLSHGFVCAGKRMGV